MTCAPLPGWCALNCLPCNRALWRLQGTWTSGTTVVDIEGRLGQPANANVALALDVDGFQRWVAEVLALAP